MHVGGGVCEDIHYSNIDNGKKIVFPKGRAIRKEFNYEAALLQRLIGIRIDH